MKFTQTEDAIKGSKAFVLVIDVWDYIPARFNDFDRWLIEECEKSAKVSDKLLALETITRRIEEAHNG